MLKDKNTHTHTDKIQDGSNSTSYADAINQYLSVAKLLELAPDAMIIVDETGQIILANKLTETLFGYSAQELKSKSLENLLPERFRKKHIQHRKKYFENPTPRRMGTNKMSLFLKRKDGVELPCDVSLSFLNMRNEQHAVCSIRDVSALKATQNELQKHQRDHLQLLENTNAVPWEANAKTWEITYVGPQVDRLLGYESEEWLTQDFWLSHIHPEDRVAVVDFCDRSSQRLDHYEVDYRMIAKNGEVVWVKDIVNVIRVDGVPEVLRGFMINVTETKNLHSSLTKTLEDLGLLKDRIESLSDNAPVGLCYLDTELRFVHINKYFSQLTGVPLEQHIGRKVSEILPNASGLENKLQQVLKHGKAIYRDHAVGVTPDNSKTSIEVTYQPDKDPDGKVIGIRCVVIDITEIERLEAENILLRDEVRLTHNHTTIIGQSPPMCQLLQLVEQVAPTEASVLIIGETGTGKELIAKEIHNLSAHSSKCMITVNCAALPATLIESELFGREKGAFTGALTKQLGRFEAAHQSTIFLDEIGELALELQPKLLRVLEEGELERLGGTQTIKVKVRVITATNKDLHKMVKEGKFRADLFYRLNAFPLSVPPLRERPEDIPELVWFFIEEYNHLMGKRIETVAEKSMQQLQAYPWPGNVRELRNIIERSMILTQQETLNAQVPNLDENTNENISSRLMDVEKKHILNILNQTNWRVRGKQGAAEILDLNPSTLESRMVKMGIKRN